MKFRACCRQSIDGAKIYMYILTIFAAAMKEIFRIICSCCIRDFAIKITTDAIKSITTKGNVSLCV